MSNNIFNGQIEETRDVHIGDNNYSFSERKNKAQFEKLSLSPDQFRNYLKPRFTDDVIEQLNSHCVLLIGGNYSFNKGHFLKYVALASRREGQEVKECTNMHNFTGLSAAIYEETQSSVFILNNLTAKDISYRFKELKRLAVANNHMIVIGTEEPYKAWNFDEDLHHAHWFEIPEKDIYSNDVLQQYFTDLLEKQKISLPINPNRITDELTDTEQIDRLVELLHKHKGPISEQYVLETVRLCKDIDQSSVQYWFDNLPGLHKLVVIGIALFDGAYENQFFEGFERLLNNAWRKRDKELKSIDYEDLIPLTSFFKTDGTSIRSKFKGQRRKIIKLAWRTHKRYILSALPVLRDIVIESCSGNSTDWELLGTEDYQYNIRHVISETLSDIGLHAFDDVENILLQLASQRNIYSQIVAAKAISRWKLFEENKIYDVLERWQHNPEVHRFMQSYAGNGDNNYLPLSYIQATVILTLFFSSQYEMNGKLSEKNKELLLKFRLSSNKLVLERMQWTLDRMTAIHPSSLANTLRDNFLKDRDFYVEPIAFGLANAYNNGFSNEVKTIMDDWMKYYDNKSNGIEDPASYTHRDRVLSAVIIALGLINYKKISLITVEYTYELLESFRQKIHNHRIRGFLIETLVNIIEENFYTTNTAVSINMISNIDKEEREYMVAKFVEKYLSQRKKLTNGDYRISFTDGLGFYTWANQDERPRTHIEKLMSEWKKNHSDTLSQIALKSFVEFDRIEMQEKEILDDYIQKREDRKNKNELRKKELEEKGTPQYDGNIQMSAETITFVKLCKRFVQPDQNQILNNIAIIILQQQLNEKEAERLLLRLDDSDAARKKILFVYKMYRDGQYQYENHPLPTGFQAGLFFTLSFWMVPADKRKLLKAFSPFLMTTPLNGMDVAFILNKIKYYNNGGIKLVYYLCKYPVVLIIVSLLVVYLIFKIIF